jgi:hypothetical protein
MPIEALAQVPMRENSYQTARMIQLHSPRFPIVPETCLLRNRRKCLVRLAAQQSMVGVTVENLQECLHGTVYMISAQPELGWPRAHISNIPLEICVDVEVRNQLHTASAEGEVICGVSDCDKQCSVTVTCALQCRANEIRCDLTTHNRWRVAFPLAFTMQSSFFLSPACSRIFTQRGFTQRHSNQRSILQEDSPSPSFQKLPAPLVKCHVCSQHQSLRYGSR